MSLSMMANAIQELNNDVDNMHKAFYGNDCTFGQISTRRSLYRMPEQMGKFNFQLCLDVPQFEPTELCVKITNNCVVIEGKHEEREDSYGFVERYFKRRFALPEGCDRDKVRCVLSPDGILMILAHSPDFGLENSERTSNVHQMEAALLPTD